jgi:beta-glucuronidase
MLYPQPNPFRQTVDLSGHWDFRTDPEDQGTRTGWIQGFDGRPIAVPASWNDQFAGLRDYQGPAWYQTRFDRPWGWAGKRVMLRFGSVNYLAEVWLNGTRLGAHEGGHLPFEFDITEHLRAEDNRLVVRVDGELAPDRVPPGKVPLDPLDTFGRTHHPDTTFDFFPFCGIHRPALLYATPADAIADLTVTTAIDEASGRVRVEVVQLSGMGAAGGAVSARFTLDGHGAHLSAERPLEDGRAAAELAVPDAVLWRPGAPNLYDLTVELLRDGEVFDRYALPVGIRTIEVAGDRLLLNGEPIVLRGFGRHEDFPVTGRGQVPAVQIKDYALMDWVGANSFRTTHYPYAEETLMLADRLGFLVIDETPAVGLSFQDEGLDRRLELCQQYTRELIARDKNHPSVILWSLANEPHSKRLAAVPFFRTLVELARSLDESRPVTIVSMLDVQEESFDFCAVVCLNLYRGWYQEPGRLEAGFERLSEILDAVHRRFGKPILLTEFGADAIPGHHALPPEMFSEEYQAEMLAGYIEIMDALPYVAGQHVWNLCDFKTAQAEHRTNAMNYKGVFTRDRRPKMAAHRLRALWSGDKVSAQ